MKISFATDSRVPQTSSRGNQEKWHSGGRWYKADLFGYEALSEVLVSSLLEESGIEQETNFTFVRYKMEKICLHGRERTACSSENFLKEGQTLVTVNKLLTSELGKPLTSVLSKMKSNKKRIEYLAETTAKVTGLKEFPQYLTLLFEIDAVFLNDDRHLNNIAVLHGLNGYEYCPIFDNGAALLSDTRFAPMDIEPRALIKTVKARPFNTSFTRQRNTAIALYGSYLKMPELTKEYVAKKLEPLLEYYPKRDRALIQDRVLCSIKKT